MIHVSQQQLSNCISMISRGISTQIDENKQNVNLKKIPEDKKKTQLTSALSSAINLRWNTH